MNKKINTDLYGTIVSSEFLNTYFLEIIHHIQFMSNLQIINYISPDESGIQVDGFNMDFAEFTFFINYIQNEKV